MGGDVVAVDVILVGEANLDVFKVGEIGLVVIGEIDFPGIELDRPIFHNVEGPDELGFVGVVAVEMEVNRCHARVYLLQIDFDAPALDEVAISGDGLEGEGVIGDDGFVGGKQGGVDLGVVGAELARFEHQRQGGFDIPGHRLVLGDGYFVDDAIAPGKVIELAVVFEDLGEVDGDDDILIRHDELIAERHFIGLDAVIVDVSDFVEDAIGGDVEEDVAPLLPLG